MTFLDRCSEALSDARITAKLVGKGSWRRTLESWVYVPIGCLIVMLIVFGVRSLILLGQFDFPASVLLLIALFLVLVGLDAVLPKKAMDTIMTVIRVPLEFTLRYINLFFTPPFVVLPLTAETPTGAEVGKIIAVFVIGWMITTPIVAWMVRGYNLMTGTVRSSEAIRNDSPMAIPIAKDRQGCLPSFLRPKKNRYSQRHVSTVTVETTMTDDTKVIDKSSSTSEFVSRDQSYLDISTGLKETPLDVERADRAIQIVETRKKEEERPETRPERWARWIQKYLDTITWTTILLTIGLPTFYATDYTMPAFLSSTILIFFVCNSLPQKWKMVFHPIITTTGFTILLIWLFAVSKGMTLNDALATYQVGNTHRTLFSPQLRRTLPSPGAGDFLSSLLDVSVVGFAIPMYRYRRELFKFFIPLIISVVLFCFGSLFIYPIICNALSMPPDHSLAFSARSVSMPLAVIIAENLEADVTLTAALAAVSGVLGALVGLQYLRLFRIPDDDFVAKGISLGLNSAAPVTALLLEVDPPAAALSSLSLSLVGILMIIMTIIPAIADAVRSLVGL